MVFDALKKTNTENLIKNLDRLGADFNSAAETLIVVCKRVVPRPVDEIRFPLSKKIKNNKPYYRPNERW